MRRRRAVVLVLTGLVGSLLPVTGVAQAAELVSIERVGLLVNIEDERDTASMSADGRYVAYVSASSEIVPDDRQSTRIGDVFLYDADNATTIRVSVDLDGGDSNGASSQPSVSGDGRYVAFTSSASDLVAGDESGFNDVFVRDVLTGTTVRVSVDAGGGDANFFSGDPSITSDGRYVAFSSAASDLVPGDNNNENDIYVRDLQEETTVRVTFGFDGSDPDSGSSSPAISADGRIVAFDSDASNLVFMEDNNGIGTRDVYVHDLDTGITEALNVDPSGLEGDGQASRPTISEDGQFVAFASDATNLVADDGNGERDAFVHDLSTGITERVSLSSTGGDPNNSSNRPSLSSDGRFVSFESSASNLVPGVLRGVFVRDRLFGTTVLASSDDNGVPDARSSTDSEISGDGRYVSFDSTSVNLTVEQGASDEDTFRKDLDTQDVVLASPDLGIPLGWIQPSTPSTRASFSGDGQMVAFLTGFGDIWLRDWTAGTTVNVTTDNGGYIDSAPVLDADGSQVAYVSGGSGEVPGYETEGLSHVFVRDMLTGVKTAVSVTPEGDPGNGYSDRPSMSADGRYLAFDSTSSDLVAGDTNGDYDVFVRDLLTGITSRVSVDSVGGGGNSSSSQPSLSADGRFVAFSSDASNLVAGDVNGTTDVFVRDLQAGTTVRASVDSAGDEVTGFSWQPSISGDGRVVAFLSDANDLVSDSVGDGVYNVFVHDVITGVTDLVSAGVGGAAPDAYSFNPAVSADGRLVAFDSFATNLVVGDPDIVGINVYVRELAVGETVRVSVPAGGGPSNSSVEGFPAVSSDGKFVVFSSDDSNLVPEDSNNQPDIFLAELSVVPPVPVCLGFEATIVGAGTIGGTAGADVIVGSAGADVISGLGGDDVICGLGGDDQLLGGAGADSLSGGEGADTLTGGAAVDLVSFEDSVVGVQVDLVSGVATGQGADTIGSVENVRGSGHDDVILGSGAVNSFEGGGGADQLVGRGGNDLLAGGDGDDLISGMAGDDGINGGIGSDLCVQGSGVGVPVDCESSVMPVSISDASVVETDTGTVPAVFTVSVPLPTDTPISMTVSTVNGTAVAGVDYTARSGFAVSIPANQTSRTVSVVVRGDYTPEPDETFTLDIANLVGGVIADGTGTGIIVDEDPVESLPLVSIDDFEVVETNRASLVVQLRVSLSAPFPVPVTVDFATGPGGTATAGADYTAVAPTRVTFAAGVTERVARVTLLGDTVIESDETLMVVLSNALNAVIGDGEAEILIIDDDTVPVLLLSPVTVVEGDAGNTAAVFTVELDRPYGVQVRVRYATVNGSATGGSDYTSIGNTNLTFAPGQTSRTINVQVVGDLVVEPDETFSLFFSNPLNVTISTTTVQGTITNDD